jgi:hypothetical protein
MAMSNLAAPQPDNRLETEIGEKWQRLFGEPLPITGALDLAIGILRDLEDQEAAEAKRLR